MEPEDSDHDRLPEYLTPLSDAQKLEIFGRDNPEEVMRSDEDVADRVERISLRAAEDKKRFEQARRKSMTPIQKIKAMLAPEKRGELLATSALVFTGALGVFAIVLFLFGHSELGNIFGIGFVICLFALLILSFILTIVQAITDITNKIR